MGWVGSLARASIVAYQQVSIVLRQPRRGFVENVPLSFLARLVYMHLHENDVRLAPFRAYLADAWKYRHGLLRAGAGGNASGTV
jgi:hypothetical protein